MKLILILSLSSLVSCATISNTYEHFKTKEPVDPYAALKHPEGSSPLAIELYTPEKYNSFKKAICQKKSSAECDDAYLDMFNHRLAEKYIYVNWSKVQAHCKAYPVECQDAAYFERKVVEFHNQGVEDARGREIAAEEAESNRRTALFFTGLAQGVQQSEANRLQQQINQQNKPVNTFCQKNGPGVWCQSN